MSAGTLGTEVLILGPLPPPVTGAAANTAKLMESLLASGVSVVALNTSAGESALTRSLSYHFRRLRQFASNLYLTCRTRRYFKRRSILYLVPDGGAGIWYTLAYVLAIRYWFTNIVIQHRTHQYIDQRSTAMLLICKIVAPKVLHVFLSARMERDFQKVYKHQSSIVCSNAAHVRPRLPKRTNDELVVGHLSNLCEEKGFFDVVETFEALVASKIPTRLLLAGPAMEKRVIDKLAELTTTHRDAVEFVGPLAGQAKDAFYDKIDVFLFPTRWPQEAQPNVLYEAFAAGATVIAYGRGCIGEMIGPESGWVVPTDANFSSAALPHLTWLWHNRHLAGERSAAISEMTRREVNLSNLQRERLLNSIKGMLNGDLIASSRESCLVSEPR